MKKKSKYLHKNILMQSIYPLILYKIPYGKTGLFKTIVEFPETEEYQNEARTEFIVKELNVTNNKSVSIRIDPVLCEAFINRNFRSQYLNTAKYVTVQNSVINLFYEEAQGDFNRIGKANFNTVKTWTIGILKGITYLHLHRIIHGDIKASNILIFDNVAKLSDFGSSALLIGDGKQTFNNKMYTPTHRAPEVWNSNEWDLSADIWSLGCTLFELFYGYSLFQVRDTDEEYKTQLKSWCDGDKLTYFDFSSMWKSHCNAEINNIILRCLNPIASERPTIFEILNSLDESKLSSSPPCNYGYLEDCPIVTHRIYNRDNFIHNPVYEDIYRKLQLYESDDEIRMLVMSMYQNHYNLFDNSNLFIKTLLIVVNLLVHRSIPPFLSITRQELEMLLTYSSLINFNYIDWDRFYVKREVFTY